MASCSTLESHRRNDEQRERAREFAARAVRARPSRRPMHGGRHHRSTSTHNNEPPRVCAPAVPAYSLTRKSALGRASLEERFLHNKNECIRRFRFNSLFDQLKRRVPATRDKECVLKQ
ncbi:hypothetical protein EVAR_30758_1 [Eumeta japonica]|uniref:Uncharacterized protein n=1 Tax=Eumeta variegata TaxID=151549 RepID=A0A4C1V8Z5_EUMVA|nr:hypothetical protein EVAR_30758_1 [Eumeta japonica]